MKALALALLLLIASWPLAAQDVKPADLKAYQRALAQYHDHHYRDAAKQMRQVAQRNPKSADAQFWLGMMSVKNGFNTTGIRRYFSQCLTLAPSYPHPLAHYYMALIYYTDNQFESAIDELDTYFQLAPHSDDKEVQAVFEEASNYLQWSRFLAEATLNTAPFQPVRMEGVSSVHNELMPYLTLDGSAAYYLREVPLHTAPTYYNREMEQKQWQLFSSTRQDTAFSRGALLAAPFNSGLPEGGVSLTADGTELYFSIIHEQQGYPNSDLYLVRREKGQWLTPEALGPQVNSPTTWESQPTVSPDGQRLIFASNRKGGAGGIDLWQCHRLPSGDWSRATNLGTAINTPGNEKAPFLAADGHTLYFLSDGWQGFGGYDLYFINLDEDYGNRPTNLGLPINTEGDENGLGVTLDGRWGYYAGRLPNSRSSDILTFDLYPAARPEAMSLHRTTLVDSMQQPLTATVLTPRGLFRSHDGTATFLMPRQEGGLVVIEAENHLPTMLWITPHDINRDRVPKEIRMAPATAGTATPLPLDPHLTDRLDAWTRWLTEHPRIHLVVECPKADDAKRIVAYWVGKGLRAERFTERSGSAIATPRLVVQ